MCTQQLFVVKRDDDAGSFIIYNRGPLLTANFVIKWYVRLNACMCVCTMYDTSAQKIKDNSTETTFNSYTIMISVLLIYNKDMKFLYAKYVCDR